MGNNGQFKKGFDARRHLLNHEDRVKGYRNAPSRIKSRIRSLYRAGRIVKTGETVYREYEEMNDEDERQGPVKAC